MAQYLGALVALPEDSNLFPDPHESSQLRVVGALTDLDVMSSTHHKCLKK